MKILSGLKLFGKSIKQFMKNEKEYLLAQV